MSNLSQESVQKLAQTIAPQVFEYISDDGRYIDGLMNTLEPAIVSVIGHVSPELVGEIGCAIYGLIGVVEANDPYAEHNIWKTRYETLHRYEERNIWKTRYETLHRYVRNTYAESYVDGAEYGMMDTRFEDN